MVVGASLLLLLALPPAAARAGWHARPVFGALVRGFDTADGPFAAGHRGVDYAVTRGEPVRASGGGRVTFADTVAGARWVTVDHGGDLLTTVGPLAAIDVRRGTEVGQGDRVGTAGGTSAGHDGTTLHWSARRAGTYIDPTTLLGDERWVPSLVGANTWEVTALPEVPGYDPWGGEHRWGRVPESSAATERGWVFAPNPNHVIGVAGITSRTGEVPMRLDFLGYAPEDITYLSYLGRAAEGDPRDPRRDQAPYGPQDTMRGIHDAAERLHTQLQAQWRRDPTQAVDLVGHSMGGVVITYYLLTMYDPADPTLPPLDHVVTLASPLQGADAAWAGLRAGESAEGARTVDRIVDWLDAHHPGHGMDPFSTSVADLPPESAVIAAIARAWESAVADPYAGPLALGTDVLTTGATLDLVVPEHRSELPDAPHVVLPGDHTSVRHSEAALQVVHAFLANQPLPGEDGGLAHWTSYGTSALSRLIGEAIYEGLW